MNISNEQRSKLNRNTTKTNQIQFLATATNTIIAAAASITMMTAWSNRRGFSGTDKYQNCSNQDSMEMHTLILSIFPGLDILVPYLFKGSYVCSEMFQECLSMRLALGFWSFSMFEGDVGKNRAPLYTKSFTRKVCWCGSKVFWIASFRDGISARRLCSQLFQVKLRPRDQHDKACVSTEADGEKIGNFYFPSDACSLTRTSFLSGEKEKKKEKRENPIIRHSEFGPDCIGDRRWHHKIIRGVELMMIVTNCKYRDFMWKADFSVSEDLRIHRVFVGTQL